MSCLLTMGLVPVAAWGQPPASPRNDANGVIDEFPINLNGDLIMLPVHVGGKTYPFMVDTGCGVWSFDCALRHALVGNRGELKVMTASALLTLPAYEMPAMSIGKLRISPGGPATCMPLHDDIATTGQDVYGVIGFDFLRKHILQIDFDKGTLAVLKRAGPDCGHAFPLDYGDDREFRGRPSVTVELPWGRESFLVDTGCCSFGAGAIAREKFNRLMVAGSISLNSNRLDEVYTLAGGCAVRSGRVESLTLGPFRHEGLEFCDTSMSCLGLGYLSRYVVTFDFPRAVMYLRPGKQYNRDELYSLGGIKLARWEGKTVVGLVDRGGPDELAGLAVLDEIISVDGDASAQTSIFELSRKFAKPGRREVVFVRDGEQRQSVVVLEKNEAGGNRGEM